MYNTNLNREIKDDTFVIVYPFMRKQLNLKGGELMVYAIIYGFCHDSDRCFEGSMNFLCKWSGCSRRSICTYLDSLVRKGYIVKIKNSPGVPCHYKLNEYLIEQESVFDIKMGLKESLMNY